ncbi:hypothetical protein BB560_000488 [Smittium megazygosporum]|uniref:Anoctamin transmembrane domain-containing protein n=1 Tax=Smittium megazygosporum TaxID=133381 RepID=A0A2T9Z795_9FUNG|nr:hypothetical protein BB560_005150 [Smittium megazygosporum]PVV04995.1 hypothetical protein BB560_000488 [Smittium megazygosporum]
MSEKSSYSRPLLFKKLISKHWELQKKKRTELVSAEYVEEQGLVEAEAYADYVISFEYSTSSKNFVLNGLEDLASSGSSSLHRTQREKKISSSFTEIINRLNAAGLTTEVRTAVKKVKKASSDGSSQNNNKHSDESLNSQSSFQAETQIIQIPNILLIFVTCSKERLEFECRKQRILSFDGSKSLPTPSHSRGTSNVSESATETSFDKKASKFDLTESARQAIVYQIISGPVQQGCANVTVENEPYVTAIFPLHDKDYNKEWLKSWSTKWLISKSDLQDLRNHFGEEIAMYFAFLQFYTICLGIPAFLGIIFYLLGWSFSIFLTLCITLWCVTFLETWTKKQKDLAYDWGVHNLSLEKGPRRNQFKHESFEMDTVSGELVPVFPSWKRWVRRAIGIPIIFACLVAMFSLVGSIFSIQVFVNEVYDGPFSNLFVYIPAILYSASMPIFTEICRLIARHQTEFENYEYSEEYYNEYYRKIFLFRFLQDQGYLLLMAWVIIPFREYYESTSRRIWLLLVGLFIRTDTDQKSNVFKFKEDSTPAANKIQNMLIYYLVTAQIVNQFSESFIPVVMRYLKEGKLSAFFKSKSDSLMGKKFNSAIEDRPHITRERTLSAMENCEVEEAIFISKVTKEAQLPSYDTFEDYAEMASQFGYVSFYSIVWPLAPLLAFVNNIVELRSDAAKICLAVRKPIPIRSASIGPWQSTFEFTSWLGSIASALLVYKFSPVSWLFNPVSPKSFTKFGRSGWVYAFICAVISEHTYLVSVVVVGAILSTWQTESEKKAITSKRMKRILLIEQVSKETRKRSESLDNSTRFLENQKAIEVELAYGLEKIAGSFKQE